MNDISYLIKTIINVIIILFLLYIVGRLFLFLLPVILVIIVLVYIYKIYNKTKSNIEKEEKSSDKIMDAEVINEKFDK